MLQISWAFDLGAFFQFYLDEKAFISHKSISNGERRMEIIWCTILCQSVRNMRAKLSFSLLYFIFFFYFYYYYYYFFFLGGGGEGRVFIFIKNKLVVPISLLCRRLPPID